MIMARQFSLLLVTIIAVQLIVVALIFLNSGKAAVHTELNRIFEKAKDKGNEESKVAVDAIQSAIGCCGYTGPNYWSSADFPQSCCPVTVSAACTPSLAEGRPGCLTTAERFVEKFGRIAGVVGIVIAGFEIVSIWFAVALAWDLQKLQRRKYGAE